MARQTHAWEIPETRAAVGEPDTEEASSSHPAAAPVVSLSSFAAGSIAGAAGTLVGHPLDTMKVHAQTNSLSRLSWRSLWRGAATPMATAGAVQCLNLGLFDTFRRLLSGSRSGAELSLPLVGVAAAAAGLSISPLTAPLTQVKVVQQLRGGALVPTAASLWRDGLLYRGLHATALLESCRAIYLTTYVAIKRAIASRTAPPGSDVSDRAVPLWGRVVAGALGNMLCWAVAYPIDVVRTHQLSAPPPAAGAPPRGSRAGAARFGRAGDLFLTNCICRPRRQQSLWQAPLRGKECPGPARRRSGAGSASTTRPNRHDRGAKKRKGGSAGHESA